MVKDKLSAQTVKAVAIAQLAMGVGVIHAENAEDLADAVNAEDLAKLDVQYAMVTVIIKIWKVKPSNAEDVMGQGGSRVESVIIIVVLLEQCLEILLG
ncbi:MAG: hypothetical protein LKF31_04685 [Muribaculaceae bacterium]|jgi:hypothetical protein|nr:hypothetical protein [Muribaculaceae bacterium]